ncbi:MAG: nitrilase-related carbon-nitrogen hydrolase [Pirellulaceae bacterium]|nr:nitrilase-related carbon-nitrogen hydrolase [Pirellulaceae bacterium]
MPSSRPFLASVVQAAPMLLDTERTLKKLGDLAADAAGGGARLAVFPEAFVGGYPKGISFGTTLGIRTPEGRDDFRRYFEGAIAVPGPATERIGQIARENRLHLVLGVIERAGGTLYCTALFFSPTGELLGRHRKLMPTALERVVWGCGDGSTLPVLETPLGKLGAVICWENYMPLLRTAMYAQGIELYCAPTVDDRDTWAPSMRHIACEGRCFVLSACQVLRRRDCPADFAGAASAEPNQLLIRGGSCIASPLGKLLAGPKFDDEAILTAEIDPAEIVRGKFDLDVTGHYARPDIFRLLVNRAPQSAVDWETRGPDTTSSG